MKELVSNRFTDHHEWFIEHVERVSMPSKKSHSSRMYKRYNNYLNKKFIADIPTYERIPIECGSIYTHTDPRAIFGSDG